MKQTLEKITREKITKLPNFFNAISNELVLLEENLTTKLGTKSSLLQEIVSYIFKAGGKRIRPALCFLIAKSTGKITNKHIILSELTELIHTASLIHDDIIDSARLRRGRETINSLWNDKISVITGDFLFAQASIKLGELENTEIVKLYAKVLSDLCDGEINQYSYAFNPNISWEYYINKSTTKTASLFAACCKSASILNNKTSEIIYQAEQFGINLGIAFQIVDDILDFTSNLKETGKEVGTDLKQGIITAPTLFALNSQDERAKQIRILIENRFQSDKSSENEIDKVIRIIIELDGCEKAKQLANKYILKAKESLVFVCDQDLKNHLLKAADFILDRIN